MAKTKGNTDCRIIALSATKKNTPHTLPKTYPQHPCQE
jgi:hypothetical protein